MTTAAFRLDVEGIVRRRQRAAARSTSTREMADLAVRVRAGERLGDEDLASLFLSAGLTTDALLAVARELRPPGAPHLETFSPLYLTNECDAECRLCGMRRANARLLRETADGGTVAVQLDILYRRGLRGVALLTGEYHPGSRRRAMIDRVASALRAAFARGYAHVLVNIGALEAVEYDLLLADLPRAPGGDLVPRITICTFQETYDPEVYARFMGTNPANPRSDFERRLTNFDRARDAGICVANPGILLGLEDDVAYELLALLAHVAHLQRRGMEVYVSLPRLRRASGTTQGSGVDDDTFCRLVAVLAFGAPEAKVVVSTREPPAIQRRLLPVIGVLTAGSPGVAPYTDGGARFDLKASQFEVLDQRPIEVILGEFVAAGVTFDCFESAGSCAAV